MSNTNPLIAALNKCKLCFWIVFWFAFVINLLMLITPLYSLQVLDRVIGSGNLNTLLMLSLIIGFTYFIYGLLQIARSFLLIKIGEWMDITLSPIVFSEAIASCATRVNMSATQLLRDLQTIKTFLTSVSINTIFDAPWSIIYIIVIFLIHPYIGYITLLGGFLIVFLAFFNAYATNSTLSKATEFAIKGLNQAEIANRNAESIEAMGMIKNVSKNWSQDNMTSLNYQSIASYRNSIISNISRFIRNIMQMAVTGVGAYVVVSSSGKDMTTGAMIMSSIIVGRALAPFDNAIELWKSINSAIKAFNNLNKALVMSNTRDDAMPISSVLGKIEVESLFYTANSGNTTKSILKDISFNIEPAEIIAIVGPSAAGKSSLAKILVGVWQPTKGTVRLDGAEVYKWNRENFGQHVGYLPQGIELFNGTVKQNIARMAQNQDPTAVIAAAKIAGAHEMILKLTNGYDTDIGVAGSNLSGGQKQRVALARAFYGDPKFIVLDEPNANLDEAGELALSNALIQAKQMHKTVVVISHRPGILAVVDKILVVQEGSVALFGHATDILNKLSIK